MTDDYTNLPDDLPEPRDDGAADHLPGVSVPAVSLPATDGTSVVLPERPGRVVVYCYPKTGRPDEDVIPEGWAQIPGAYGCTAEACGFRKHHRELRVGGAEVFGLSTQPVEYQREARDRLGLPYELLSDADLELATRLRLPTFAAGGETLVKRLTLVLRDDRVERVFYPIFPPDEHAGEVVAWLDSRPDA